MAKPADTDTNLNEIPMAKPADTDTNLNEVPMVPVKKRNTKNEHPAAPALLPHVSPGRARRHAALTEELLQDKAKAIALMQQANGKSSRRMSLPQEPAEDLLPGPMKKNICFVEQPQSMTTVLNAVVPKLNLSIEAKHLFADTWTHECFLYDFFEEQRGTQIKVGPWLEAPGTTELRIREISALMPIPPKPMCPKEAK